MWQAFSGTLNILFMILLASGVEPVIAAKAWLIGYGVIIGGYVIYSLGKHS